MFTKILIANRGEIACRVIETARKLGIKTVAVYSDADRKARHVRLADDAVYIGGAAAADSYLKADVILKAAQDTGAQAIHPGYGFLSENTDFAKACEKADIKFIGPSAKSIDAMGLKDKAKDIMEAAGVPVVPGYKGDNQDAAFLAEEAQKVGYPVLIKAVAGGGGKGMRLVEDAKDFAEALKSCQREAKASFSNDHVLIEKYITKPRHVEVQVFGDSHGNAVPMFERDCSLQRRHQKVVEEAPAPGLPQKVRDALGDAAVKAVQALGYENAGTIEFIMDSKTHEFFFMEMNTRLQVEHPVTEMITGLDLVEWQLRVAAGEKLPLDQDDIVCNGHAFEVRLYAEDPATGFLPQSGKVEHFSAPEDVRLDTAVEAGDAVTIHYDPMVAKLIVHGKDRDEALEKMRVALAGTVIGGLNTNQEFLSHVFVQKDFAKGDVDTGFIARFESELIPEDYGQPQADDVGVAVMLDSGRKVMCPDPWNAADNWRAHGDAIRRMSFSARGQRYDITLNYGLGSIDMAFDGKSYKINDSLLDAAVFASHKGNYTINRGGRVVTLSRFDHSEGAGEAGAGRITTPMPGKIIDVMVQLGDKVEKDQPLLIMEAMKMEMTIRAGCDGVIDELPVSANDQVADGALLVSISEDVA
ncbi:MAG: acetyl/propionyl/methylcrotonyl-CoA carboxylase subunit alpha [Pseudomonadota bacterium]|nr:acetyl/propionyl/methylcrotonyl-CoA carboxylase subunit alpha [Pseudomonadota bacterium]